MGIGTSSSTLGMTIGIMPSGAYFARMTSTRAKSGMAGYGSPEKSIRSITRVRSSPVTVSVGSPPAPPPVTWWCVMTPSISTVIALPTVTAMTTRTSGIDCPPPPGTRRAAANSCSTQRSVRTRWRRRRRS